MKLSDLDATFRTYKGGSLGKVAHFREAQGVLFQCPMPEHTHMILVWFHDRKVPDEAEPKVRWHHGGTGIHDLTLSPSIDCTGSDPTCFHGRITNGQVV